jgi:hypothetical protein
LTALAGVGVRMGWAGPGPIIFVVLGLFAFAFGKRELGLQLVG